MASREEATDGDAGKGWAPQAHIPRYAAEAARLHARVERNAVVEIITSPVDGARISAPFTVTATLGIDCYCDEAGCFENSPEHAMLDFAGDAASVACDLGTCKIDVEPGPYTITIRTDYGYGYVYSSMPVSIVVEDDSKSSEAEGNSGTSNAEESSDGSTGDSAGAPSTQQDFSGCACSTGSSVPRLDWCVFLVPFAFRYRRSSRRGRVLRLQ